MFLKLSKKNEKFSLSWSDIFFDNSTGLEEDVEEKLAY